MSDFSIKFFLFSMKWHSYTVLLNGSDYRIGRFESVSSEAITKFYISITFNFVYKYNNSVSVVVDVYIFIPKYARPKSVNSTCTTKPTL